MLPVDKKIILIKLLEMFRVTGGKRISRDCKDLY